jgi:hypothetical protein
MNKQEKLELEQLEELFNKRGALYVNPKYKKMYPGHRFILPQLTVPGEVEMYKAAGYDIVFDLDGIADAGEDKPANSSPKGSMVTITGKLGSVHVLMHAPEEVAKKLDKMIELRNKQQRASLGYVEGIRKGDTYGDINIK